MVAEFAFHVSSAVKGKEKNTHTHIVRATRNTLIRNPCEDNVLAPRKPMGRGTYGTFSASPSRKDARVMSRSNFKKV